MSTTDTSEDQDRVEQAKKTEEGWKDLTEEERLELLEQAEEEVKAPGSVGSGSVSDQEALDAVDQINQKMDQAEWSCTVLDDIDVDMRVPSEEHLDTLGEMGTLFDKINQEDTVEDVPEEVMEEAEEMDRTINILLGGDPEDPEDDGLVAEEGMDFAYFEDGSNYPAEMRTQLVYGLLTRYQSRVSHIMSFRSESEGS